MNVTKLMTRAVQTCLPHDSLHTVAGLMWDRDCGVVPIVDAERKLVGIVTDRDLCMAAWTKDRRLMDIPVADVMSRHVQTCQQYDSLESVLTLMRKQRVRRLPVVDREGQLVGIVSLNDLVRGVAADRDARRRQVESEELVLCAAGICEPRSLPIAVQPAVALEAMPVPA